MRPKLTTKERFDTKYKVSEESGCWLWVAYIDNTGYGSLSYGCRGDTEGAHRVSYELYKGPIPKGMCILHTCDTPTCVNPDHLFLGTQLDNIKDRNSKGRAAKGETHGSAKLTEEQVVTIRKEYAEGCCTQAVLATKYKVTNSVISGIINRRYWKHV